MGAKICTSLFSNIDRFLDESRPYPTNLNHCPHEIVQCAQNYQLLTNWSNIINHTQLIIDPSLNVFQLHHHVDNLNFKEINKLIWLIDLHPSRERLVRRSVLMVKYQSSCRLTTLKNTKHSSRNMVANLFKPTIITT